MSDKIYTSDGMCQGCGQPVRRYISRGKSLVIYFCNGEHPDAESHCGTRITFGRKVSDAILAKAIPLDKDETDHDPEHDEEETHDENTPDADEEGSSEEAGDADGGPDGDSETGAGDDAGSIDENDEGGRSEEAGGGPGGGAAEERGGMDRPTSLYERRRQRRTAGQ